MNPKQVKIIKWSARLIALITIVFGLPFYFGYGNPLPFIDPDYSIFKNIALTMNLLIFIGLGLGWKYEKISGYLIILALAVGLAIGLTTNTEISMNMITSIIPGALYLFIGYNQAEFR